MGSAIDDALDSYLNPELDMLYQAAGHRYGINPLWLKAQDKLETGPRGDMAAGDAQHIGHGQIGPAWRKKLGLPDNPSAEQGIFGMAQIMSELLKKHNGNLQVAQQEYNGGPDTSKWGPHVAAYPAAVAKNFLELGGNPGAPATLPVEKDAIDSALDDYAKSIAPPPAKATASAAEPWTGGSETAHAFLLGGGVAARAAAEATAQALKQKSQPQFAGQDFGSLWKSNYNVIHSNLEGARDTFMQEHPTGALVADLVGGLAPTALAIAAGQEYAVAPMARSIAGLGPRAEATMNFLTGTLNKEAPALFKPAGQSANALTKAASRVLPGIAAGGTAGAVESGLSPQPFGKSVVQGMETGGILGPLGGAIADGMGSYVAPRAAEQINKLLDRGVPITASQIPGAGMLARVFAGDRSGAAQRTGLTRALSHSFGEDTDVLDNEAFAGAQKRINGDLEQFKNATIQRDPKLASDLIDHLATAYGEGGDENWRKGVGELAGVVQDILGDGQEPISGSTFLNLTKSGSKLDQLANDPLVGFHAAQIKDSLYDALERSVSGANGRWVPAGQAAAQRAAAPLGALPSAPRNALLGTGSATDIRLPAQSDSMDLVPQGFRYQGQGAEAPGNAGGRFSMPRGPNTVNPGATTPPPAPGMIWEIDPDTQGALTRLRDARGQYKNMVLARGVVDPSTGEVQPGKLTRAARKFYPPSANRPMTRWEQHIQDLAPASQFVPNAPTGAAGTNKLLAAAHAGGAGALGVAAVEYGPHLLESLSGHPLEYLAGTGLTLGALAGKRAITHAVDSPAMARLLATHALTPQTYSTPQLSNRLLIPPAVQLMNMGDSNQ